MPRLPRLVLVIGLALALLPPATVGAQSPAAPADTPEQRLAEARKLVDLQWPGTQRSIMGMLQSVEASVPPEHRKEVHDAFDRNFDFEEVRQYSAAVLAKDLSVAEIDALVEFYSSPLGHSVMTKMPQVMQDTIPYVQGMMMKALNRPPPGTQPRDL